jgi:hypothetical protein
MAVEPLSIALLCVVSRLSSQNCCVHIIGSKGTKAPTGSDYIITGAAGTMAYATMATSFNNVKKANGSHKQLPLRHFNV